MIRSADVRADSDARQWEARLNREWPQRAQVAAWIVEQISANSASSPRVVELACGAGYLAEELFRQLPAAHYCGFDLSPYLLDYARRRYIDGRRSLSEILDLVMADIEEEGMDVLDGRRTGAFALFRRHELAAAFNRLRSLKT